MFYHIVTTIRDEEELMAKYHEFAPNEVDSSFTFYYYPVKTLVACQPLQKVIEKMLKNSHEHKELVILYIDTLRDIQPLSQSLKQMIFKRCLHINSGVTEPFNSLYKEFF